MYIKRLGALFVLALALAGGGFIISTASAGSNLCPSAPAYVSTTTPIGSDFSVRAGEVRPIGQTCPVQQTT